MTTRARLWEILNACEWACAHALHENLTAGCHALAMELADEAPDLARRADAIAAQAEGDLPGASRAWMALERQLLASFALGDGPRP